MFKNPRAVIVRKKKWENYVLLTLKSPRVAGRSRPGQFLMIRVSDRPCPLLRRPLSIHGRSSEVVEVFFTPVGVGTSLLAEKRPQETLDILGPLGRGFAVPRSLKRKIVWVVGGGRGIAPLYFLAQELLTKGAEIEIFYGAKTRADLPLLGRFAKLGARIYASTDDGSFGFRGLVSSMFEKELARRLSLPGPSRTKPTRIYACGPDAMLKKIAELARRQKIPAQVSLESFMGCGIGACWSCVRKIGRGTGAEWVKVCEDGPVFPASEVIWEEDER
ncbi:MAG: dihydroorotate dehydrogenase electron transfer subunit [Acidobacteriota bacterium]